MYVVHLTIRNGQSMMQASFFHRMTDFYQRSVTEEEGRAQLAKYAVDRALYDEG
jgi:hypothetical protein